MAKLNLSDYVLLQKQIEDMKKELKTYNSDENFQKELSFLNEIEEVISKYGKTKEETANLLCPKADEALTEVLSRPRKKRTPKTYKNPHTGETVTTAGGNHKTLKKWREDHPDAILADWIVE